VRWLAGELVLGAHLVGHRRSKPHLQPSSHSFVHSLLYRRFVRCVHAINITLAAGRATSHLIRGLPAKMADPVMKETMHDTEGFGSKTTYREGAIAGEGGETKRGLKSRHIQFL
jgi:hypothetical protein